MKKTMQITARMVALGGTVTRDGAPIALSAAAAAGGDLTVDDLKAVLGIDFQISQTLNWQEIQWVS